jgi:Tol biopolymer transport system component
VTEPDWSPDGKHIAYVARLGEQDDIIVQRIPTED